MDSTFGSQGSFNASQNFPRPNSVDVFSAQQGLNPRLASFGTPPQTQPTIPQQEQTRQPMYPSSQPVYPFVQQNTQAQIPTQTQQTEIQPQPTVEPVMPVNNQAYFEPEQPIIVWQSQNRPFKKRSKEYFSTITVISILISLILFFMGQYMLIAVVASLLFVSYIMASIPPEMEQHAITTYGIRTGEQLYTWDELGQFWFTEKFEQKLVHVYCARRFTNRLVLLLGDVTQDEIRAALGQYLPMQTPIPTFIEKAADWLSEKIPLDTGK